MIKTPIAIVLCLLSTANSAKGQDDDDSAFSQCAVTKFIIANKKAIVSADVIKYTKLGSGQGTTDCMQICRALDECDGYNFLQRSKWCYILSGTGRFRRKRRSGWASGIKRCVDHSNNDPWDNAAYDSQDAKPTNILAIVDLNTDTFVATWTPPYLGARYGGDLEYKFKCGPNSALYGCDQRGWSTGFLTTNSLSKVTDRIAAYNAFRDQFPGSKCYVEAYLSRLKVSCSKAAVVSIIPTPWLTIDTVDCQDVTASWDSPFDGIESWELTCESSNGGVTVTDTFSGSASSGTVSGLSVARRYICTLTAYKNDDSLSISAAAFSTVRDVDAGCDCEAGVTDTNCDKCDVGYTGTSTCTPCAIGTYKDSIGSGSCDSCPTGKTTSGTGSVDISDCNICDLGYTGADCTECSLGKYKNTTGSAACTNCPSNLTTEFLASTSIDDCGCPPAYEYFAGSCTECQDLYYNEVFGKEPCTSCDSCTEAVCSPDYCGPS